METPDKSTSLSPLSPTPPPHENQSTPAAILVLQAYLSRWIPAPDISTATAVRSSQEIADELHDMATVEIDDVTATMLLRGFRPSFDIPGAPGWLMQPAY